MLKGAPPLCMTRHDEICGEVCDVGQRQREGVELLAHLPCNARRHWANSSALHKGRAVWRANTSFPLTPRTTAASFCTATTIPLHQWDNAIIRVTEQQQVPQQCLVVQSRISETVAPCELFCLLWDFKAVLILGRGDASIVKAGLQDLCRTFLFWVFNRTTPFNPRICCNFQITRWDG